ncbi:MAG: chemotaxis protein CheA [Nitrospirae bacterium]|nr:chemotaxis protein CheA [Nitrospirota bacterium]
MRQAFTDETFEILTALEASLLQLEEDPGDTEAVSSIFRAFHTIKGSGAMSGFDEVSGFTHDIENVYDLVRSGRVLPCRTLIDLTLSAADLIREMVLNPHPGEYGYQEQTASILAGFKSLSPSDEGRKRPRVVLPPSGLNPFMFSAEPGGEVTYRIRFKPVKEIFLSGTNPVLLMRELSGLGDCRVVAHMDDIPELDELDPEACYVYWDIILTTSRGTDAIRDVFIFIDGQCELNIEVVDDGESDLDTSDYKRLGEILIEKSELTRENLEKVLSEKKTLPLGELLIDEGLVDRDSVQAALAEQEQVRLARESRLRAEGISSLRVSAGKLDRLVNLVGELVTVQARLSQTSLRSQDPGLISIAEEIERLTAELRDNTMNIRMVPIGTTFSRFRRLVRDLSQELGKAVEITTEGAETELDKTVIEKLNDPLVHLIRNCVDHGIELPEVRAAAGKKRKGRVHLAALQSGPNVIIRISDDGAGLDRGVIRRKAVEKGLMAPDESIPERELFSMILLPGFTTSENVTNVSGRGVGMDVVKKSVEALRGTIGIESTPGVGTTITLSLPLTLAIIEGLLVEVGGEMFVVPLSAVKECVELGRDSARRTEATRVINIRSQLVPYIRLREQFSMDGDRPEREQIVIVRQDGQKVGFVVDKVIGEFQTVIKTLGRVFRDVTGVSGATILGDGSVALILDVPQLLEVVGKRGGD